MKIKVLELFAGIGACSKALKNIGIDVEIVDAVEIDKYAIKTFNAVHNTNFEPQDITKWDKDIEVDLITHGSPCFLAGEKVNTKDGFKNIESLKIGDIVKSHDGSYNKIIKTMKNKSKEIYDICCSATHNINTTHNHPFYILRNGKREWIEAKDITTKDFMCIPINKEQKELKWEGTNLYYNKHTEISNKLPTKSPRFWYLIGRFIGDGWVTRRKERNNNISGIKICCGKHELRDLENKLCNILNYCVVEDRTTYKLQFPNKELGEFCSQFGIGAKNKNIPQQILDLKTEYLECLLMGIIDSDGCYTNNKYKVSTTSRNLAYNIGELVLKTKKVPYHIYKTIKPRKHIIEGREVNQNDSYEVTWGTNYNEKINFVDNDYLYSRVRKINCREQVTDVYNIEVEKTHTYCVNNVAVHNCQDFSVAGKQAGGDKDSGTRSSLMYETIRIVEKLKPKYVLWENVKNLLSKKHRHNFDAYIETMNSLGYNSYYQVLNAKDYGIPQNRERVYTISIRKDLDKVYVFPEKEELKLKLKDMLEDKVDEKYVISDKLKSYYNKKIKQGWRKELQLDNKEISSTICNPARNNINDTFVRCEQVGDLYGGKWDKINESARRVYSENGLSPTIHTCQGGNTQPKVLSNKIRKLTPLECWRLMGFDDEDFYKAEKVNSNTQLYKEAGNSIVVKVLEKIFTNLFYGSQNSEQTLFDIEVKYDNNK